MSLMRLQWGMGLLGPRFRSEAVVYDYGCISSSSGVGIRAHGGFCFEFETGRRKTRTRTRTRRRKKISQRVLKMEVPSASCEKIVFLFEGDLLLRS